MANTGGRKPASKSGSSSKRSGPPAKKPSSSAKKTGSSSKKKSSSKKSASSGKKLASSSLKWFAGFVLCLLVLVGVCMEKGILSIDRIKHFLGLDGISDDSVIMYDPNSDFDFAVYYLDVGQGSSSLVKAGNTTVLIDAGEAEYGGRVLSAIKALKTDKIDYVVATHPHSDHIGGLAKVIGGIDVDRIIAPKVPPEMTPTSSVYEEFLLAVKNSRKKITAAKAGTVYELGAGAEMEILAPAGDGYSDLNDYSVVCRITYKDTSFLFTGDASKASESDMISSGRDISADVLAVGHHGSSTASTAAFLKEVSPSVCIISCGAGNSYGHPNESTMKRLLKFTDKIYRTDLDGNIVVCSDGEKLYIRTDDP